VRQAIRSLLAHGILTGLNLQPNRASFIPFVFLYLFSFAAPYVPNNTVGACIANYRVRRSKHAPTPEHSINPIRLDINRKASPRDPTPRGIRTLSMLSPIGTRGKVWSHLDSCRRKDNAGKPRPVVILQDDKITPLIAAPPDREQRESA
jgi:hypothetical protein